MHNSSSDSNKPQIGLPDKPEKFLEWLLSDDGKQLLQQIPAELLEAYSKVLQALILQAVTISDDSLKEGGPPIFGSMPPQEMLTWLSTDIGKQYLRKIDSETLQAYTRIFRPILMGGGPIIGS
jgi:hypothetical protein